MLPQPAFWTGYYVLLFRRINIALTFCISSMAGLSFRTTKNSLRNAFQNFGKLVEGMIVDLCLSLSSLNYVIMMEIPPIYCFIYRVSRFLM